MFSSQSLNMSFLFIEFSVSLITVEYELVSEVYEAGYDVVLDVVFLEESLLDYYFFWEGDKG